MKPHDKFAKGSNAGPDPEGTAQILNRSGDSSWLALSGENPEQLSTEDSALAKALNDFRLSVHSWSDAAYNLPRPVSARAAARTWRKAVVWAFGCVLATSVAGGGIYDYQHRRELARVAAERETQRKIAEKRAQEAEDLLARVDSDVSREVPDAMEPLARLMADDDSQ